MRRVVFLALLALAGFAAPAGAHSTDPAGGSAACFEPHEHVAASAVAGTGGVPAVSPGGGDGSSGYDGSSGGTPISSDGGTADVAASGAGDVPTGAAEAPGAVVAQEPEPQPEGPGEEQPGAPEGEPQQPDLPEEIPNGEAPGGEAPGVDTGGGLPRTGIEALQLAFLGVVLLLVGARLRVIALRRRRRTPADPDDAPREAPRPEPAAGRADERWSDGDSEPLYEETYVGADEDPLYAERDEWEFPDPHEPAPTGLLPSTASARRRARELAAAGERD